MRNCVRLTARLSLAGVLALMVGALLASTALGAREDPKHTRYRYFQDRDLTGPFPGEVVFAVLYRENPNGIFTPREMVSYNMQAQTSCSSSGATRLIVGGNAFSKYVTFRVPLAMGQWTYRFENGFENPQMASLKGSIGGTVVARKKRGGRVVRKARIDGSFSVEDWDPYGPSTVPQNCVSSGSFSAMTCKRRMAPRSPGYAKWKRWNVPKCHQDPW